MLIKALLILDIFEVLPWHFGYAENGLDKKAIDKKENLEQESFLQCLRLIYRSVRFLSIDLQNKATNQKTKIFKNLTFNVEPHLLVIQFTSTTQDLLGPSNLMFIKFPSSKLTY